MISKLSQRLTFFLTAGKYWKSQRLWNLKVNETGATTSGTSLISSSSVSPANPGMGNLNVKDYLQMMSSNFENYWTPSSMLYFCLSSKACAHKIHDSLLLKIFHEMTHSNDRFLKLQWQAFHACHSCTKIANHILICETFAHNNRHTYDISILNFCDKFNSTKVSIYLSKPCLSFALLFRFITLTLSR